VGAAQKKKKKKHHGAVYRYAAGPTKHAAGRGPRANIETKADERGKVYEIKATKLWRMREADRSVLPRERENQRGKFLNRRGMGQRKMGLTSDERKRG